MKDLPCPQCGALLKVDDSRADVAQHCPGCGLEFFLAVPARGDDLRRKGQPVHSAGIYADALPEVLPAGDEEDATPARQPRRRPSERSAWEARLREFHKNLRVESQPGMRWACLLFALALLVASFAAVPLGIKLAVGVVLGAVAGLVAYPDKRYCLIGVGCFLLAGLASAAAAHFYLAATPPGVKVYRAEVFLCGLVCWLPFFALYYGLMRLAVVGIAPADEPEEVPATPRRGPEQPEPGAVDTRSVAQKVMGGGFVFLFFGLLGLGTWYLGAGRGTPQKVLFGLLALLWVGLGVVLALVSFFAGRGGRLEPVHLSSAWAWPQRGQHRPLWRNLGSTFHWLLGGLAAVWAVMVLIALFFPIASPIGMSCLLFGVVAFFVGVVWGMVEGHHHGVPWWQQLRGWGWMSQSTWQLDLARDDPHGVGRALVLTLFGALWFVVTFAVFLVKENWGGGSGPPPPVVAAGNPVVQPAAPAPAPPPPAPPAPQDLPPVEKLFARGPREYLSDLKEFAVKNGPWPFKKTGDVGDGLRKIQVNGVVSPHGLGMHPPDAPGLASASYRLGKQAAVFKAAVALNDTAGLPFSSAVFEVYGDSQRLWQSAPVGAARQPPQECRVDVSEVDVLELRVWSQGGHINMHAVWLEPRLLHKSDTPDP
jgi:hypothetical protein